MMADYTVEQADQMFRNTYSQLPDSTEVAGGLVSPLVDGRILYSDSGKINSGIINTTWLNGIYTGIYLNPVYASAYTMVNSNHKLSQSWDPAVTPTVDIALTWDLSNISRKVLFTGLETEIELDQSVAKNSKVEFDELISTDKTSLIGDLGVYGNTAVSQPTAIADATDATTVITQLNDLLAKLRTIGLIDT